MSIAAAGNICGKSQALMIRMSLVFLTLALAISVVLVQSDLAAGYRLLLVVPYFLAWQNFYQGLFRT